MIKVGKRLYFLARRIVYEHCGFSLFNHRVDRLLISKICLDHTRTAQPLSQRLRGGLVSEIVNDDSGTRLRETLSDALADVAAGTGHEHGFTGQVQQSGDGRGRNVVHAMLRDANRGIVH